MRFRKAFPIIALAAIASFPNLVTAKSNATVTHFDPLREGILCEPTGENSITYRYRGSEERVLKSFFGQKIVGYFCSDDKTIVATPNGIYFFAGAMDLFFETSPEPKAPVMLTQPILASAFSSNGDVFAALTEDGFLKRFSFRKDGSFVATELDLTKEVPGWSTEKDARNSVSIVRQLRLDVITVVQNNPTGALQLRFEIDNDMAKSEVSVNITVGPTGTRLN